MRGRALPVILAAVSVVAASLAVWPELSNKEGAGSTPALATPVLSVRRIPDLTSRAVADSRLRGELDAVINDESLGPARDQTCLAVAGPDGRTVYGRQTATPLIPASTMKLVTASVALSRLGPDASYRTAVQATVAPDASGMVAGDLWLVGSGDPLLATANFAARAGWLERPRLATPMESLADSVVASGVRRVTGRVIGDESRYDEQRYVPSWKSEYATAPEVGPQSALTVNGGFESWEPRAVPTGAPAVYAAKVLAALLRERGVEVAPEGAEGQAPGDSTTVAFIDSPPLGDVVGVMLRDSDNLAAELVTKELGLRFGGAGTTAAGTAVLEQALAESGLPAQGADAVDGSGLDRSDRLSCDLLQSVLERWGEESAIGRGLPQAGTSGTLTRRFQGTPADGRVKAKTGSLDEVVGLSGWAATTQGGSVRFSLIANGLARDRDGLVLQDRVVSALAVYPQAPPPAELGPLPVRPLP